MNSSANTQGNPSRLIVWRVVENDGFETTWLDLQAMTLRARGRVAGQRPGPYWLDYTLETDERAVTRRLSVTADTTGGQTRLDLVRGDGGWTVNGAARPDLDDALDCDLGLSPLTNTMPVIRDGLHVRAGTRDYTMAWVEVPSLRVTALRQRYEHLSVVPGGARVRYSSGNFSSDLLIDADGIVVDYPLLGHRVESPPS